MNYLPKTNAGIIFAQQCESQLHNNQKEIRTPLLPTLFGGELTPATVEDWQGERMDVWLNHNLKRKWGVEATLAIQTAAEFMGGAGEIGIVGKPQTATVAEQLSEFMTKRGLALPASPNVTNALEDLEKAKTRRKKTVRKVKLLSTESLARFLMEKKRDVAEACLKAGDARGDLEDVEKMIFEDVVGVLRELLVRGQAVWLVAGAVKVVREWGGEVERDGVAYM